MDGQLDRSNGVVYDSVVKMKEKHYPYSLIKRNKEKVNKYEGCVYKIIRPFVDISSYEDDPPSPINYDV